HGSALQIRTEGHCFKLFLFYLGTLSRPQWSVAFALKQKRPLMFTVDQFLLGTGPYQERNGGVKGSQRKSQRQREKVS
ncbi:hypothetical protein DVA81_19815, partial [Acinetobacter baumannii]